MFLLCLNGVLQLEDTAVALGMVAFNRFLGYLRVGIQRLLTIWGLELRREMSECQVGV